MSVEAEIIERLQDREFAKKYVMENAHRPDCNLRLLEIAIRQFVKGTDAEQVVDDLLSGRKNLAR